MESETNIFMKYFNENKNNIYKFLYFGLFLFTFLFTLFISFLIVFKKLNINNIQFIYFYITFCVGLFFLLGILYFNADFLSLMIFIIYFFYSFLFLFILLRRDVNYKIYFKSIPIFTSIMIIFIFLYLMFNIIVSRIAYKLDLELDSNIFYQYLGLNVFSALFILLYGTLYSTEYQTPEQEGTTEVSSTTTATISTTTKTTEVSYYKIYVFIMCSYYFMYYFYSLIEINTKKINNKLHYVVKAFLFFMLLGLILFAIKINGKSSINLKQFLWMEYTPLFITLALFIGKNIYENSKNLNKFSSVEYLKRKADTSSDWYASSFYNISWVFMSFIMLFYFKIENSISFLNSIIALTVLSLAIIWFAYFQDSKFSNDVLVLCNYITIFIIFISLSFRFGYSYLGLSFILLMTFGLGLLFYFSKVFSLSELKLFYILYFFILGIIGIILLLIVNFIPEISFFIPTSTSKFTYSNNLINIDYTTIFKVVMMLIILITLLSFANFSYKIVENFLIVVLICILPCILFYLFYTTNKKTTDSNIFISIIKVIGSTISSFLKNMKNIVIFIFIIILAIFCLYNLIVNKYTSFDIYFLSYFFFLILYITYYFSDILKGKSGTEKFIRQVSLINLLLFFTGIIIYYILAGLGYVSNKFTESEGGSVSSQNLYSKTIFYLIVFIFITFIYLYYRNNISPSANPYVDLFINIIFYIPCLFLNVIEFIQTQLTGIVSTITTKDGTVIKTSKDGTITKTTKEGVTTTTKKDGSTTKEGDGSKNGVSTIMKDGIVKTIKDGIVSRMSGNNKTYYIILIIEIILILFYIFTIGIQTIYDTQGGINLIREPIDLNKIESLVIPDKYSDHPSRPFAFSFWFFVNSQMLTTNKYYNLFNYQYRPQVLYNPKLNILLIDVSGNTWEKDYLSTKNINKPSFVPEDTSILPNNAVDISGNERILNPEYQTTGIIYINNKILIQKWNHLVINYNGSVMDIFLNGSLVNSSSQVVPNVQSLLFSVGQDNGINGGICNLNFYNHALTYSSVVTLYQSVKDKNPPVPSIYWDTQKKKIKFSQLNNLKEQYKINKILNI